MIARIIALTEKKPVLALVTVLLIGLSTLAGVIKILDDRNREDEKAAKLELDKCNEEKELDRKEFQVRFEKLNEKFEKVLLKTNEDLQERIDRVDNVTRNSKRAVNNAKYTVRSQGEMIKELNDSTKNDK